MRQIVKSLFVCVFLVSGLCLSVNISASKAYAGPQCHGQVLGVFATGAIKKRVKKRARNHWRQLVKIKHGGAYNNWDCAKKKRYECVASPGGLHCAAAARPCKC